MHAIVRQSGAVQLKHCPGSIWGLDVVDEVTSLSLPTSLDFAINALPSRASGFPMEYTLSREGRW